MSQAWQLLRCNRAFSAYWGARLLSLSGDQIGKIALLMLAYQRGHNAWAVSALLLAMTVPYFFGPLAGAASDRFDPRGLMIGCEVGQTAIFVALALAPLPYTGVVGLVGLTSVLAALFQPAGRSRLPALVEKDSLQTANGLLGLGLNTGRAAGPLVGGLLVAAVGPERALLANAASFAVSALLLRALPARDLAPGPGGTRLSYLAGLWAGLETLRRHPVARTLTAALSLTVAFASLDNVALVFLAGDALGGGSVLFGLLAAVYGIGMAVAPGLLLLVAGRAPAVIIFLTGCGLNGAGNFLTGLAPFAALAGAGQAAAGAGNGLENVATDTVIQQRVQEDRLGTVFGAVYTAPMIASGVAYVLGGPLVNALGPRLVFVISGLGILAVVAAMPYLFARTGEPAAPAAGRP